MKRRIVLIGCIGWSGCLEMKGYHTFVLYASGVQHLPWGSRIGWQEDMGMTEGAEGKNFGGSWELRSIMSGTTTGFWVNWHPQAQELKWSIVDPCNYNKNLECPCV